MMQLIVLPKGPTINVSTQTQYYLPPSDVILQRIYLFDSHNQMQKPAHLHSKLQRGRWTHFTGNPRAIGGGGGYYLYSSLCGVTAPLIRQGTFYEEYHWRTRYLNDQRSRNICLECQRLALFIGMGGDVETASECGPKGA